MAIKEGDKLPSAKLNMMKDGKPAAVTTHGALRAGDATFHAGWTIHGAAANPSPTMRSVMTIIYFADGTRIAAPNSDAQRGDHKVWLASLPPGELAVGPKNPLVYPSD